MQQNGKILDRKFFPAGTLVIRQGTLSTNAFLIESGKVEVFASAADGHEVKIAELGPQSIIGEMAALTNEPRSASVRTIEDTILIALTAQEIKDSARKASGVFQHLMTLATDRMKETRQKLMQPAQKPPPEEDLARHIPAGGAVSRMAVPAGTLLIEQGTTGTQAFLIESGKVEVFIRDGQGHETRIAELGPKSLVGEMAAITNKPRSASVRALEETVLVAVSSDILKQGVNGSENLQKGLMRIIMDRLQDTQRKLTGK
jgi:CRP-like cAMP-binding protein